MKIRFRFQSTSSPRPVTPARVPRPRAPEPAAAVASNDEMTSGLASVLAPINAICLVFGCWRLAQDFGLARNFFIENGVFSHWQSWLGLTVLLTLASSRLNRSARGGDEPATN